MTEENHDARRARRRARRVAVRGPQLPPTAEEVLGDPSRGHVREKKRAERATRLRQRQLRMNLVFTLALIGTLALTWVATVNHWLMLAMLVYPALILLAGAAFRWAQRIEAQ